MPYITPVRRRALAKADSMATTLGELNYLLSTFFFNKWKENPSYDNLVEIQAYIVFLKDKFVRNTTKSEFNAKYGHLGLTHLYVNIRQLVKNAGDRFRVQGVLDHVAFEFYRRVAVPYEELKIAENGDIFLEKEKTKK